MKNDIRVNSWDELQSTLYKIEKDRHNKYRSNFVYRGVGDESWSLQTSLQRLGPHYRDVEGPLLRNFVKYAGPGELHTDMLFFRLAVAQHHGLPTRVLDWTTSPRVAAHFVTWEEKDFEKDGAIWCVDVVRVRELLPPDLLDIINEERAYIFSIEMLDRYKKLSEFDLLGRGFVLFFEPPLPERAYRKPSRRPFHHGRRGPGSKSLP